jgi:hypothetical protein
MVFLKAGIVPRIINSPKMFRAHEATAQTDWVRELQVSLMRAFLRGKHFDCNNQVPWRKKCSPASNATNPI